MSTITTTDDTQIDYKDWGSSQPVVCSHGWPLSADAWEDQMVCLATRGYRCIAHDRRGHGRASQPWHGNDMDTYADDLATPAAQLDLTLDPLDQEAIRSGVPRVGMSADEILFLWDEPYYTAGDARRYAHWYYLGSSVIRSSSGYHPWGFNNRVDVYLVGGKVVGWVDVPTSRITMSDGANGN
jgi:hypothetical protein